MTITSAAKHTRERTDSGAHTVEAIGAAVDRVQARFPTTPDVALVLGTGLGALGREIAVRATIDYTDIPGFPLSTVESHAGRLLCGTLGGKTVIAMQGRFHRYEGYTLQQVTFPVRVLQALGATTLIVSNACGGMNPLWTAGDLMLISDHINLLGDNPLVGYNDDRLGPRFPDMSAPYHPALRALGADVVGMSTVPEVIVAVHGGMRVLGVSIVTDQCLPDALEPASLDRILAVAAGAEPTLTALVRGVLERL